MTIKLPTQKTTAIVKLTTGSFIIAIIKDGIVADGKMNYPAELVEDWRDVNTVFEAPVASVEDAQPHFAGDSEIKSGPTESKSGSLNLSSKEIQNKLHEVHVEGFHIGVEKTKDHLLDKAFESFKNGDDEEAGRLRDLTSGIEAAPLKPHAAALTSDT